MFLPRTARAPVMPPTCAHPVPAHPLHLCWGAQPPPQQTCSNAVTTCPVSHPTSHSNEALGGATTTLHAQLAQGARAGCPHLPTAVCCQALAWRQHWASCPGTGASTEPRAPGRCTRPQTATGSHRLWMSGSSSQPQEFQNCEDQPSTPQKPVLHIPVLLPPPALSIMLAHRPQHVPG